MRILIIALAGLLTTAIAVQLKPAAGGLKVTVSQLDKLPIAGTGWSSRPLSAGQTEAESANVAQVLKYDDIFYREFTSTGRTFSVYAVYWSPGKMPTQLVASHTPDRCWTSAGWNCTSLQHGYRPRVAALALWPGEYRIFVSPSQRSQHVLYWHLVGGTPYDFGDRFNAVPSAWRWWRDAARQIFSSPPAQYFVRVSSDQPLAQLAKDPAFVCVFEHLANLGLAAPR